MRHDLVIETGVLRVKVCDVQQVKILPGNWVAPASSYRSDCGGDETVGAFEKDVSLLAMQRADRP